MKILFLIDSLESSLPRDQNHIIKYMADKGHEVTVLTSRNFRYEKYDREYFSNVKILRGPILFRVLKVNFFFHPFMLKFKKFDVVHAFTFFTFSSIIAPFFRGKKHFLRSEILDSNQVNRRKANRFIYKILIFYYRLFYSDVYGYSNDEAQVLKALGFSNRNIFILPLMVDTTFYKRYLQQSKFSHDPLVIGTIARITPVKGIHILPRILEYLLKSEKAEFEFYLAGRVDDEIYATRVLSRFKSLLGHKFHYLGEVASPEDFYEKVDVVIVPSLAMETGAIVTLESMAAGKVVVANDLYPMNKYIRDSVNGYLYTSAEDACCKILGLLLNPQTKNELSNMAIIDAKCYDAVLVCRYLERKYLECLP